jgi:N-acetylmuramoyl-L-alanine amidase
MNSLLYYLLQVMVASGILYSYYHFVLRNKKFHQYNRFYLLAAAVISILVPFLNIPVYFTQQETQSSFVLQTLTTISSTGIKEPVMDIQGSPTPGSTFNYIDLVYYLYIFLAVLVFIKIIISLFKIRKLIHNNPTERLGKINFVNTDEPGTPFSFFRWLFWNRKIELRSEKGEQVFRHELFHIQQKHSLDIIFMELLTVAFWINPFFVIMKRELKAIHEFLADKFAVNENEKWGYAELLLMQTLKTTQSLVNPFFHNQIKRRIAMITTSKKPGHQYFRKIMVLPVAAIVVSLFAFSYKNRDQKVWSKKPITIVIDAAHGGTDRGAISFDKKYSEAQITLEIAQQIKKLAKQYNVNVVMTREDDKFPGNAANKEDGLRKRIEIANKVKPDAFIAIHVNAAENAGNQSEYSGIEAYVSDKKEDGDARLLGSAILRGLAPVYKTSLELKQRKEAGIYVLDHNSYPAVLLECGYINNLEDLAFITNKASQEKIARSILEALVKYKNSDTKLNEFNSIEKMDTIKPKNYSVELNATVKIAKIDSVNSKEPSEITINGKKFQVKDLKIEGLEDSKIEAAEFHTSNRLMASGDTVNNPLIVIDGVIAENLNVSGLSGKINADDIQSINILKGASAIAKYGNKGKYGAIEIITKKNSNSKVKEITLEEVKPTDTDNKIFEKVEIESSFPGGETAWRKYLEANLNSSVATENGAPAGVYTVYVQFIVHKDGSTSYVSPLTNHGFGMEQEAMRIINKSTKWIPAIQNGRTVNAYRKQPINFLVKASTGQTVTPKLSLSDLKNGSVQKLFQLDEGTEIISFTFTIDLISGNVTTIQNSGNKFNNAIINEISKAKPGRFIVFEQIKIIKDGVEKYIPARFYELVD